MALTALRETIDADYSRHMPIHEIDESMLHRAREIFDDYKRRGVVVSGRFDDMSWTLTDEATNVGVTLLTFEGGMKEANMALIGCTHRQYLLCAKAYIVFCFGEISLRTIQNMSRALNRFSVDMDMDVGKNAGHIAALLRLIPGGNADRDAIIDELDEKTDRTGWGKTQNAPRCLAAFRSYLRFDEVLSAFWRDADGRGRLFYFPLYFWWKLTAILPLRPMEFLLTPRECLNVRNGANMLTVRRTKLKGGYAKISYCVSADYVLCEYAIDESLAEELQRYIKATAAAPRSELDTLLAQEPHYGYFGMSPMPSSRYYTYANLGTCLRYFYDEVITPGGHDIAPIRLGDTRHLAMTNLILSGGSPAICRELAGHANIEISSRYYSNISNLVVCATLERHRKTKGDEAMIRGIAKYPLAVRSNAVKVEGGRCASELLKSGSIDDCLKVMGSTGHVGECRRCAYYLPDDPGVMFDFYDDEASKKQVDADSQHLIRMIELVRKGIGHTEDIGAALLKLQRSGNHYSECLLEKYNAEDMERWQDQEK
jgi:hypothetical protein